ncbi:MAG: MFS transporter [Treponema sp.]|jgi:fucose permease|nr:MFS transporter [Treponema sp.]
MQRGAPNKLLFFIIYGTMFIFGLIENIKGVSYPLIKAEFNASYEQQGLMVSLLSSGYVFFCMVAGFFLARFGVKRALLSGFICIALGLFAVSFMPRFWTIAAALFLVFAGFGFFEVGINALATQVFISRAALFMNLAHFFYGVGAVIGPKGAGMLTDLGNLGWRQIYLLSIPLLAFFFVPTLLARFPGRAGDPPGKTDPASPAGEEKRLSFLTALRTPMVWIFAAALGLMVVVEMGSTNWGSLYFQDVYGFDPRTRGAGFVSGFFILFTISRLASGFLVEKIGYMRSLIGATGMVILIFILGFGLGERGIWVLPALGFFIAIMWPTTMAVALYFFGPDAAVMSSAIIVLGGAINAVMQLFIGLTNRYLGAAWGYRSCLIYALLLIGVLLFLRRRIERKPRNGRAAA